MTALSNTTDLTELEPGTIVMALPEWFVLKKDTKTLRKKLKKLVQSQWQNPMVKTLDLEIADADYINWCDIGLFLGMQRIRTRVKSRKGRSKGRRTGVNSSVTMQPIFLFGSKRMITDGESVRPIADVPDWVVEYVRDL